MKYYIELVLNPSQDVPDHFLWSNIFRQLHLAMTERYKIDKSSIGITFPDYQNHTAKTIGRKIRLFSDKKETLQKLNLDYFLKAYKDYCRYSIVLDTPNTNDFVLVSRYRPKDDEQQTPPYIKMKSLSNKNMFSLFILQTKKEENATGDFNTYGLSAFKTLPSF